MNIGRNDPCPCGSGKKYKKCCLAKDEEARREEAAAAPPVLTAEEEAPSRRERPKPPPDPRMQAWNARYDEFQSSDYEGRIALFMRTLDEPDLMDGEMAFEMLNELFEQAAERDERDRFDSLVESLRERAPEAYEKEKGYLLENRIVNALAMNRPESPEVVDSLALELALTAGKDIDRWIRVEKGLAYHGYSDTLVKAMRLAWPKVRSSGDIVPWGVDEFSHRASHYEMLTHIARTEAPKGDDPELMERLRFYFDKDLIPERLVEMVALMSGQAERRWTMEDFKLQPPKRRSRRDWDDEDEEESDQDKEPDVGRRNLTDLTLQFVNYARRVEGAPYARADLARGEIYSFISERYAGELEYAESMLDSMLRSSGQKRPPIKNYKSYEHLLCPDYERMDHYLGRMLNMLGYRPHNAAALWELIPAWMRFLQTEGLIDADLRKRTLNNLKPLADVLLKIFNNIHSDPALREPARRWPEDADKEPQ